MKGAGLNAAGEMPGKPEEAAVSKAEAIDRPPVGCDRLGGTGPVQHCRHWWLSELPPGHMVTVRRRSACSTANARCDPPFLDRSALYGLGGLLGAIGPFPTRDGIA
jgi:hypothetical protein